MTSTNLVANFVSLNPYLIEGNVITVLVTTTTGSRVAKYTWATTGPIIKTAIGKYKIKI